MTAQIFDFPNPPTTSGGVDFTNFSSTDFFAVAKQLAIDTKSRPVVARFCSAFDSGTLTTDELAAIRAEFRKAGL